MESNNRRIIGLLAAFVLIFAVGALVGRNWLHPAVETGGGDEFRHHNHIMFLIRPDGNVNVSPQPGDEITWFAEAFENGALVRKDAYVKFVDNGNDIPCDAYDPKTGTHKCKITSLDSSYFYSCKTDDGRDCADPRLGPGSTSGMYTKLILEGPQTAVDKGGREPQISCSSKGVARVDLVDHLLLTESIQWTGNPFLGVKYSFTLDDPDTHEPICVDAKGAEESQFSSNNPIAVCFPSQGMKPGRKYPYSVTFTDGKCKNFDATISTAALPK